MSNATMSYGSLELSERTISVMAIIVISLMGLATILYTFDRLAIGGGAHFVSFVMTVTLMVTWLTELSQAAWDESGPFPIIGAVIVLFVNVAVPLWLSDQIS